MSFYPNNRPSYTLYLYSCLLFVLINTYKLKNMEHDNSLQISVDLTAASFKCPEAAVKGLPVFHHSATCMLRFKPI